MFVSGEKRDGARVRSYSIISTIESSKESIYKSWSASWYAIGYSFAAISGSYARYKSSGLKSALASVTTSIEDIFGGAKEGNSSSGPASALSPVGDSAEGAFGAEDNFFNVRNVSLFVLGLGSGTFFFGPGALSLGCGAVGVGASRAIGYATDIIPESTKDLFAQRRDHVIGRVKNFAQPAIQWGINSSAIFLDGCKYYHDQYTRQGAQSVAIDICKNNKLKIASGSLFFVSGGALLSFTWPGAVAFGAAGAYAQPVAAWAYCNAPEIFKENISQAGSRSAEYIVGTHAFQWCVKNYTKLHTSLDHYQAKYNQDIKSSVVNVFKDNKANITFGAVGFAFASFFAFSWPATAVSSAGGLLCTKPTLELAYDSVPEPVKTRFEPYILYIKDKNPISIINSSITDMFDTFTNVNHLAKNCDGTLSNVSQFFKDSNDYKDLKVKIEECLGVSDTTSEINTESEGVDVSSGVDVVIQYIDKNLNEVKDISKFLVDLYNNLSPNKTDSGQIKESLSEASSYLNAQNSVQQAIVLPQKADKTLEAVKSSVELIQKDVSKVTTDLEETQKKLTDSVESMQKNIDSAVSSFTGTPEILTKLGNGIDEFRVNLGISLIDESSNKDDLSHEPKEKIITPFASELENFILQLENVFCGAENDERILSICLQRYKKNQNKYNKIDAGIASKLGQASTLQDLDDNDKDNLFEGVFKKDFDSIYDNLNTLLSCVKKAATKDEIKPKLLPLCKGEGSLHRFKSVYFDTLQQSCILPIGQVCDALQNVSEEVGKTALSLRPQNEKITFAVLNVFGHVLAIGSVLSLNHLMQSGPSFNQENVFSWLVLTGFVLSSFCFGYAFKKSNNAEVSELEGFGISCLPGIFCAVASVLCCLRIFSQQPGNWYNVWPNEKLMWVCAFGVAVSSCVLKFACDYGGFLIDKFNTWINGASVESLDSRQPGLQQ